LKDFNLYFNDARVVRKVRNTIEDLKSSCSCIVIISPEIKIPRELERTLTVIDFPLPDYNQLKDTFHQILSEVSDKGQISKIDSSIEEKIIESSLGLIQDEAERVFNYLVTNFKEFNDEALSFPLYEKEQIIKKHSLLNFCNSTETLEDLGGLDKFKNWIVKRQIAFTKKAKDYNLPNPKGLHLIGLPGCGKSLASRVVSSLWKIPLLRLDLSYILSCVAGVSENNLRKALKLAESISPCILLIEDAEKSLSGMTTPWANDGTLSRIFSTLSIWMQERTKPVFVIMTSNDIIGLPDDLLRKGVFDEIFYFDFPSNSARKHIFEIHLNKRNRDPKKFDLETLVNHSAGFTGAELEQSITSALFESFSENRELTTLDILNAMNNIFPMFQSMTDRIERLIKWAEHQTEYASHPDDIQEESDEYSYRCYGRRLCAR
jgi:AAA+ superfamily predicted ATPase